MLKNLVAASGHTWPFVALPSVQNDRYTRRGRRSSWRVCNRCDATISLCRMRPRCASPMCTTRMVCVSPFVTFVDLRIQRNEIMVELLRPSSNDSRRLVGMLAVDRAVIVTRRKGKENEEKRRGEESRKITVAHGAVSHSSTFCQTSILFSPLSFSALSSILQFAAALARQQRCMPLVDCQLQRLSLVLQQKYISRLGFPSFLAYAILSPFFFSIKNRSRESATKPRKAKATGMHGDALTH